jgi:hypothetical protein
MFLSELKERRGKAAWASFPVAYSKVKDSFIPADGQRKKA